MREKRITVKNVYTTEAMQRGKGKKKKRKADDAQVENLTLPT